MKEKTILFDFAVFVIWTIAFVYNIASNKVSNLDYILMYLAFICESLMLFIARNEKKQ